MAMASFCGSKAALFHRKRLLVYLRDDKPSLPFAACWDFPGGGREGEEGPFDCLQRETREEFGIALRAGQVRWTRSYPSQHRPGEISYFMAGELDDEQAASIRFGDEGQRWQWMPVDDYLSLSAAVPYLQQRLREYLSSLAE